MSKGWATFRTYCEAASVARVVPFHLGDLEDKLSGPKVGKGRIASDPRICGRDYGPSAAVVCARGVAITSVRHHQRQ